MKASKLIEKLREFDDEEVFVYLGFNMYNVGRTIEYDSDTKSIIIIIDGEDTNNII